ncbi:MAG: DUF2341 domain-containing protein [Thermoplasmatota archaeon]
MPYVAERFNSGDWGAVRQVTNDGRFSLGELDGAATTEESMVVYVRDVVLNEWLLGRWRCDEGNGSLITDDTGGGHDGIAVGEVEWREQNTSLGSMYGYGVCFDDAGEHVEVANDGSLSFDDEFTVTWWMNLSMVSSGSHIVGIDGSWEVREVDGVLELVVWQTDDMQVVSDIATVPVGVWTFIGVTYCDGIMEVMVRPVGEPEVVFTCDIGSGGVLINSGDPLIIGGFAGCIDEVWLFSLDISLSEVDSIWFTAYPTLGAVHDIVVQPLPSYASFTIDIDSAYWYDSNWSYRKEVTINHTMIQANLANYPVLVSVQDTDLTKADSLGHDFVFTTLDGTKLHHEIEDWDAATGKLVAWVNVPLLSPSEDTILYLYYGNPVCDDQQNIAGTWDAGYAMVQHMEENGTGLRYDSTSNGHHGTPSGFDGDESVVGIADGGNQFDGDNDYVDFGDVGDIKTFSLWVKPDFMIDNTTSPSEGLAQFSSNYRTALGAFTGEVEEEVICLQRDQWFSSGNTAVTNITISNTSYSMITYVWNTTADRYDIYYNGIREPVISDGVWGVITGSDLELGRIDDNYFNGSFDEVRVSSMVRNASWIAATYHFLSSASTCVSLGEEEKQDVTTEDIVWFTGSPDSLSYSWSFGDGSTGTGVSVSHQYTMPGLYTVTCNVTNTTTGVSITLTDMVMVNDTTLPVFAGLQSIQGGNNSVSLSWDAATDNAGQVWYYGYLSNVSGDYNYSEPVFVTQDLSYVVTGLSAGETYYGMARAVDAWGNNDSNLVELSTTVVDQVPPSFDGLTGLHVLDNQNDTVLLEWDAGTDASEPIWYHVFISTTPGVYNFSDPVLITNRSYAEIADYDFMNETYYFVVRAVDNYGNMDGNMVERSNALFDLSLLAGWNIIVVPDVLGFTPETFMENISGCTAAYRGACVGRDDTFELWYGSDGSVPSRGRGQYYRVVLTEMLPQLRGYVIPMQRYNPPSGGR